MPTLRAPGTIRFEVDYLVPKWDAGGIGGIFCAHQHDIHLTCHRNLAITIRSKRDQFGGVVQLAEVRLQEGESLENALRRFKRKVQQEDIIKEVKRHSFYLKPGEKKRVKEALARKRSRKKARKEQD
jgi:small subunit ribosomal protein S21